MPPLSTILARSLSVGCCLERSLFYVPLSRGVCDCEYVASMLNLVIGSYYPQFGGKKRRQRGKDACLAEAHACAIWRPRFQIFDIASASPSISAKCLRPLTAQLRRAESN